MLIVGSTREVGREVKHGTIDRVLTVGDSAIHFAQELRDDFPDTHCQTGGKKMTTGSGFRTLIDSGEGRKIPGAIFKVSKEDTRGTLSIWEHSYPPGFLAPPHAHASHDQVMFVIEGLVGARIGDDEFTAGPGAYLNKPSGIPHTMWNAGPDPARVMEVTTPGGLEAFVEGIAKIFSGGGSPDRRTLSEHAAKYDTTFVMDWIPELERKYKVHLVGGTGARP